MIGINPISRKYNTTICKTLSKQSDKYHVNKFTKVNKNLVIDKNICPLHHTKIYVCYITKNICLLHHTKINVRYITQTYNMSITSHKNKYPLHHKNIFVR